jgi:hypothetical protein
MEKYEFELLMWLNLSDREAQTGAAWYKGTGWYLNQTGKAARLIAESDQRLFASGQLEALNQCGAEGWSVAAWVPTSDPHFILQRRVAG